MIFTILSLIAVVSGILMFKFSRNDTVESIGALSLALGVASLALFLMVIVGMNLTASKHIEQNRIRYEGLCKRLEIVNSDYEDVSKSDVIADVTQWNLDVYNKKFWTYNPWTSWFNPRRVADELNYISLE